MTEKFDAFFKAKKEHSLKEMVGAQKTMDEKYQEIKKFLERKGSYLPWNREGYIDNEDYILYSSGCIQSKKTGSYLLNDLRIYKVTEVDGRPCLMIRKLNLQMIDPDRIDYEFEHDQELFNTWYSQVESILTIALKR